MSDQWCNLGIIYLILIYMLSKYFPPTQSADFQCPALALAPLSEVKEKIYNIMTTMFAILLECWLVGFTREEKRRKEKSSNVSHLKLCLI